MRTRVAVAAIPVVALVAGVVATPATATTASGDAVASDAEAESAGPPGDLPDPIPAFVEGPLASIRGSVLPAAGMGG